MKKSLTWIQWLIAAMAFVATSLSFLDRHVVSITLIRNKEDFLIFDIQYGFINTGFLISYTLMFTVCGILFDHFGRRLGLAYSLGIWSFAKLLHSLANYAFHYGLYRFRLWITYYIKSISDIFRKSITSAVIGFSGSVGAIWVLILNSVIGFFISRFSYNPIWIYAGSMYSLTFLSFYHLFLKLNYC